MSPAARPLRDVLAGRKPDQNIVLLVGPEGDFTPEELEACDRAGVGRARMGPTTMRVETAAIALLAAAVMAMR